MIFLAKGVFSTKGGAILRTMILCLLVVSSGCATSAKNHGAGWPNLNQFKQASIDALKDPNVWIPITGAAVVAVSGLDNPISKDALEESKMFHDPQGSSDDIKDLAGIVYIASAIAVPRANFKQRLAHVGADMAAASLSIGVATVLKRVTHRKRPGENNEQSFPSGHATLMGFYSNATRRNLASIDMPKWAATSLNLTVHGLSIAGGWARVEAGKHHVSDVLVGYALGNYVTNVVQNTFFEAQSPVHLSFIPFPQGGALRLTRQLKH